MSEPDEAVLAHLPWGVVSTEPGGPRRVAVRVGERVLDLSRVDLAAEGLPAELAAESLDAFLPLGRRAWDGARTALQRRLSEPGGLAPALVPLGDVQLHLPFAVADYVDFFSSRHHALRTSEILRPQGPGLPPAWEHLPIGYHGRAGTVVVSGTEVARPAGLRRVDGVSQPVYGPSRRLDVEVEVGYVVGVPSAPGRPVPRGQLPEHVFGVVLLNDWSARDVQAFETTPLGPFLGKSFATSIAGWITPLTALEAARVASPPREVPLAPHLDDRGDDPWALDLSLELVVDGEVVSRPNARDVHWTPAQQLAHLTSNGAPLRAGDLFASGTVSGPGDDERGCLLELTSNGAAPLRLAGGRELGYLDDGAEVTIRGTAPAVGGGVLHLGEVTGRVVPAPA